MAEHSEQNACARSVHRLKRRSEFLQVAAKGSKVVASTLVLQGIPASESSPISKSTLRVGFTVTKKQGGAVVRNRIRRRLKAAAAEVFPLLGEQGWDYVVIGRHTALDAPYEVLLRDLRYAARKLIKNPHVQAEPST